MRLHRAFLASGLILWICARLVVDHSMPLGIVRTLAPQAHSSTFIAGGLLWVFVTAILCGITSWGLMRRRRWSRATALAACAMLLPCFPWLTPVGAVGLCCVLGLPLGLESLEEAQGRKAGDFWAAKSQSNSFLQIILIVLSTPAVFFALLWLDPLAKRWGLAEWSPGISFLLYLMAVQLIQVIVHEAGHAVMAWAFGYKFAAICVGPVIFLNDGNGRGIQFQWARMIFPGGHVGAIPNSDRNLRWKHIVVVAAGPTASLLVGLAALAAFVAAPQMPWRDYWWIFSLTAALGLYDGIINLVPLGYSDGSMLFHLLLGTPEGGQLLDRQLLSRVHAEAQEHHGHADFAREVACWQRAINGFPSTFSAFGLCYQALGHARLATHDWPGAEDAFRKCLEFEADLATNPSLAVNVWSLLHKALIEQGRSEEAGGVYAKALGLLEARARIKNRDVASKAITRVMLAQLRVRGGDCPGTLAECHEAWKLLANAQGRHQLRMYLYEAQAEAEIRLDHVDEGLAIAARSVNVVRSERIPASQRAGAWHDLAEFGFKLCRAGQYDAGVGMIREAIANLAGSPAAAQCRSRLDTAMQLAERAQQEPQDLTATTPAVG
jgi:tetratricopeptide (TPR) repeat protein